MNRIGWWLAPDDNGTFMFAPDDQTIKRCAKCGVRLEFTATNPRYRWKGGTKRDLAATYDGPVVASRRFKDACGPNAGVFVALDDPEHFHVKPTKIVRFDPEAAETEFTGRCPACDRFEDVIGVRPAVVRASAPIKGFARTDLVFGSGDRKFPLVIVGDEIRAMIERAGLRGIEYREVFKV